VVEAKIIKKEIKKPVVQKTQSITCSVANEDDLKTPKPVRITVESMDFQGDVKL
jgi:hypothetical protein